ncbi:serine/threonine protein phosphatase [Mumia zhuanghuii]|uniref:Serine/threonine protein phosphatase n=2 Tax=Mumia TaxID=1546255 RepID=A0A5Q6RIY2_9ACTN|nr:MULTISPECIES: metallophosphoesterase [Mumia]KAA1418045.1 serine/threonine protein phosphatase [Mumia zhuanghuii]KAA1424400.1 serine/threonine protein phosphatase [Mumia zhuanghuii]
MGDVWAVSDIHGHRDVLVAALTDAGLIDESEHWSGGDARLWLLGDYVDRGPDGIGVIRLARRLEQEAAEAGGAATALLGNHEILLLGMHRYGAMPVPSDPRYAFEPNWAGNGGVVTDLEGLDEEILDWLTTRPAIGEDADHLLLHSDTVEYLEWGGTVDEINAAVRAELRMPDLDTWWEMWRRLTTRMAFAGADGPGVARRVLDELGGSRIVHGHTICALIRGGGVSPDDEPLVYADGLALDIDGGIFVGGPCLLVRLDEEAEGR